MDVLVVYAPDPDLGPDPLDDKARPRRLGDRLPSGMDKLIIWREWGVEFDGGSRTHVIGDGSWSHLTSDQIVDALSAIEGFDE